MRIDWATFLHVVIAACVGILVLYVQKRLGGPVGGIIPGVLGLFLGWLIARRFCTTLADCDAGF
jgi:hypothetical protein